MMAGGDAVVDAKAAGVIDEGTVLGEEIKMYMYLAIYNKAHVDHFKRN